MGGTAGILCRQGWERRVRVGLAGTAGSWTTCCCHSQRVVGESMAPADGGRAVLCQQKTGHGTGWQKKAATTASLSQPMTKLQVSHHQLASLLGSLGECRLAGLQACSLVAGRLLQLCEREFGTSLCLVRWDPVSSERRLNSLPIIMASLQRSAVVSRQTQCRGQWPASAECGHARWGNLAIWQFGNFNSCACISSGVRRDEMCLCTECEECEPAR